jgi:transcriptional regulator with XRE-family HTH domain
MSSSEDQAFEAATGDFIDAIRAEMTAQGLTYTEVAKRMGTDRSMVSRTLDKDAGSKQGPTLLTLVKMAQAVGAKLRVSVVREHT